MTTTSRIRDCVQRGRPIDHVPVVDFHTHLGASHAFYLVPRARTDQVMALFDRVGIDHAVTFGFATSSDHTAGNAVAYDAADAAPDRLTPLVRLHAAFPQDWPGLIEHGTAHGARGLKMAAAYQGTPEPDIPWHDAFELVKDRNWIVLNHARHPDRLSEYAEAYPGLTFIIGHGSLRYAEQICRYDNVYLCLCAHWALAPRLTMQDYLDALPLHKLLMGSDALDVDPGTAIGPIAYADIDEHAKEMILGGNAVALMRRLGWDTTFAQRYE